MVNRKGWLRIVEASISIILVLGVLLFVNGQTLRADDVALTPEAFALLDEIASNTTLRSSILTADSQSLAMVRAEIGARIRDPTLNFSVRLCSLNDGCVMNVQPGNIAGDIYSAERIISADPSAYNPQKLKIFIWKKRR